VGRIATAGAVCYEGNGKWKAWVVAVVMDERGKASARAKASFPVAIARLLFSALQVVLK
jgi:hypothetical protein